MSLIMRKNLAVVRKIALTNCQTAQDSGPLVDYLKTVKLWLDANPNEGQSLWLRRYE